MCRVKSVRPLSVHKVVHQIQAENAQNQGSVEIQHSLAKEISIKKERLINNGIRDSAKIKDFSNDQDILASISVIQVSLKIQNCYDVDERAYIKKPVQNSVEKRGALERKVSEKKENPAKITPPEYKATEYWNSLIRDFRTGINPRRKRRWLCKFDQCFSVGESVDWLKGYFARVQSRVVTEQQCEHFICKLHGAHILRCVFKMKKKKNNRWDLYRFVENNVE